MRLTILHVLAPAPAGGLERVVELLSAGQAEAGHDVHVAAILGPGEEAHPFPRALRQAGVRVHALVLPARGYRRERLEVERLCRELRPAVVHTHGYRADVVDGPVARRLGLSAVTTVHGFTGGDARNRVYEWLQCRAFRRFQAVVAVSRPLARLLASRGIPRERIHTIRNAWSPPAAAAAEARRTPVLAAAGHAADGAPLPGSEVPGRPRQEQRRRLGLPPDVFHLGWVGRLSREKGADLFVEALARLGDLPLVATIVGDGAERARLEARARELGLAERVRWPGLVPSAATLFPAFDAFVLSSRTEGTPMVLFEAMHARTPIVAACVGGVPDVVGDTALLVPPGDPAGLAAALRATYRDPAAAARRADAARARLAAHFDRGAWLRHYDRLYRSLISG